MSPLCQDSDFRQSSCRINFETSEGAPSAEPPVFIEEIPALPSFPPDGASFTGSFPNYPQDGAASFAGNYAGTTPSQAYFVESYPSRLPNSIPNQPYYSYGEEFQPKCNCDVQNYNFCPQGPPGIPGDAGVPGEDGEPGPSGLDGKSAEDVQIQLGPSKCFNCPAGRPGKDGSRGPTGKQGAKGADGRAGRSGRNGQPGRPGPLGPQGAPGHRGLHGPKGPQGKFTEMILGASGAKGVPGPPGYQGNPGSNGFPGRDGVTGPQGAPGIQGLLGISGFSGPPGLQGFRGFPGSDAIYCACPKPNEFINVPFVPLEVPFSPNSNVQLPYAINSPFEPTSPLETRVSLIQQVPLKPEVLIETQFSLIPADEAGGHQDNQDPIPLRSGASLVPGFPTKEPYEYQSEVDIDYEHNQQYQIPLRSGASLVPGFPTKEPYEYQSEVDIGYEHNQQYQIPETGIPLVPGFPPKEAYDYQTEDSNSYQDNLNQQSGYFEVQPTNYQDNFNHQSEVPLSQVVPGFVQQHNYEHLQEENHGYQSQQSGYFDSQPSHYQDNLNQPSPLYETQPLKFKSDNIETVSDEKTNGK